MIERETESQNPGGKKTPLHGGDVYGVARSLGMTPDDLLDFSASINPLGYPEGIRTAIAETLGRVRHYPDRKCSELKRDLAGYHGLTAEQILVGNGSTELIYLLPRTLGPQRAVVVTPAFSDYERALKLAGVPTVFEPTREEDGFQIVRCPDRAKCDVVDMVFLANPASPSGALLSQEKLLPIVEALDASGAYTVVDEAFVDFTEEASLKSFLDRFQRLIILRSFTKFFGIPGIRLGYVLSSPEIVSRLEKSAEPWSVGTLAEASGRVCLKDVAFIERTRKVVAEEREFLTAGLKRIDGLHVYPASANYLLVKIEKAGFSAAFVRRELMSEGILIRDASNFRGLDERFFRTAVRLRHENERILDALERCLNRG